MSSTSVVPGKLPAFQWKTTLGQHKSVLKDYKNKTKAKFGAKGREGVDLRRAGGG